MFACSCSLVDSHHVLAAELTSISQYVNTAYCEKYLPLLSLGLGGHEDLCYPAVCGLSRHLLIHRAVLVFRGQKEFHPMDEYGGHLSSKPMEYQFLGELSLFKRHSASARVRCDAGGNLGHINESNLRQPSLDWRTVWWNVLTLTGDFLQHNSPTAGRRRRTGSELIPSKLLPELQSEQSSGFSSLRPEMKHKITQVAPSSCYRTAKEQTQSGARRAQSYIVFHVLILSTL